MTPTPERLDFMPPPSPGLLRAIGLALLAHLLLMAALTWGVRWKRETQTPVVEAELWSALEQQAAPPQPPPPEAAPQPTPAPQAVPDPAPERAANPVAPPPAPDIALAQPARKQPEKKNPAQAREPEPQAQRKREQDPREQRAQEQKRAEQKRKPPEASKSAEQHQRKQQQQDAQLSKQRDENLKRMTGLAEASGSSSATGTAQKSAAPSASYQGRVVARVRPNIVYTEGISGNPQAEVEVRTAPDGTIISSKLTQPSGNPAWDEAVLKALAKTEVLPRDTDGRVPQVLVISFRPVN